jgi:hypothetical protein
MEGLAAAGPSVTNGRIRGEASFHHRLIVAVLTAVFVICLAACAGVDDELTRMLDDAEQAEYLRKWSEDRKRRKGNDRTE